MNVMNRILFFFRRETRGKLFSWLSLPPSSHRAALVIAAHSDVGAPVDSSPEGKRGEVKHPPCPCTVERLPQNEPKTHISTLEITRRVRHDVGQVVDHIFLLPGRRFPAYINNEEGGRVGVIVSHASAAAYSCNNQNSFFDEL